jgi:hypothetical protein
MFRRFRLTDPRQRQRCVPTACRCEDFSAQAISSLFTLVLSRAHHIRSNDALAQTDKLRVPQHICSRARRVRLPRLRPRSKLLRVLKWAGTLACLLVMTAFSTIAVFHRSWTPFPK